MLVIFYNIGITLLKESESRRNPIYIFYCLLFIATNKSIFFSCWRLHLLIDYYMLKMVVLVLLVVYLHMLLKLTKKLKCWPPLVATFWKEVNSMDVITHFIGLDLGITTVAHSLWYTVHCRCGSVFYSGISKSMDFMYLQFNKKRHMWY